MKINKDKAKEFFTFAWAKISGWFLAQVTLFWEDYLHEAILKLAQDAVDELKGYRDSKDYAEKRDAIYDKLFEKVNFPIWLRPFKGLAKSAVKKAVAKKVDELIKKLDKTI